MPFLCLLCAVSQETEEVEGLLFIKNAEVNTVTKGIIRGGDILIEKGKIKEIGQSLEAPKGAKIIDAKGMKVFPGLISAYTTGFGIFMNKSDFYDQINCYDARIQLAASSGLTTVCMLETSGGFLDEGTGDQTAPNGLLKLAFGSLGDMGAYADSTQNGMKSIDPALIDLTDWVSGGPAKREAIRKGLKDAVEKLKKPKPEEKTEGQPKRKPRSSKFELLVKGEVCGIFNAGSQEDILNACTFAQEFPDIKAALMNPYEAYLCIEQISRARFYCILSPRVRGRKNPARADEGGFNIENATRLSKAGIKIALIPPSPTVETGGIGGRNAIWFPMEAAFAVRGGMSEDEALRAMTVYPAEILGISNRVGSLEVGKDADIIIADGDLLYYKTLVQYSFVNGKLFYDLSKDVNFGHLRRK